MILLTGGSGTLGRELQKHLECYAPTHAELDVTKPPEALREDIHLIVHCAAYTDVAKAEEEYKRCHDVNAQGTMYMALFKLPLVYISTSYVFDGKRGDYSEDDAPNPINAYARSKVSGEHMATIAPRFLIIRTLFKERPFPHPKACTDQWSNGSYVDVIAPLVTQAVKLFETKKVEGILHIGTERISTYDLARQTRDVEPTTRSEICTLLPRDISLSTTRWKRLISTLPSHTSETESAMPSTESSPATG